MRDGYRWVEHVGDVPTDWDVLPLAQVAEPDRKIVYGIVQAGPHVPDGVPYIRSMDVGGQIKPQELPCTSPEIAARYKRSEVRPGDIVFSLRGNIGACSIVPTTLKVANLTQGTARIAVNGRCNNHFIRYALQSKRVRDRIAAVAKGSTFHEITIHDLRRIVVPIPPPAEQARIATTVREWDRMVHGVERLGRRWRSLKRGLMQQLLTGRRRFPGFTEPWRECHIGDVVREVNRPVEWNDDALYRLVSVRRWAGGVFVRDQLHGREIKVKKLCTIHAGDMLISHIQSAYGAMALVGPEFDGQQVSELYTVLVPRNPKEFDIRFFAYLAQRQYMWHQAYVASNGFLAERLRLNFSPADFLKRPIRVPPTIGEQRRIIDVLENCDREIAALNRQLELLKDQKKGLMQRLLTGRIRVPVRGEVER